MKRHNIKNFHSNNLLLVRHEATVYLLTLLCILTACSLLKKTELNWRLKSQRCYFIKWQHLCKYILNCIFLLCIQHWGNSPEWLHLQTLKYFNSVFFVEVWKNNKYHIYVMNQSFTVEIQLKQVTSMHNVRGYRKGTGFKR